MPVEADGAYGELSDDDLALMLMIRLFERRLLELFSAGKIAGTTHTCLGQEYIPVALLPLVMPAFVVSNHRGHGHYLAQFRDPAGLLAEILGRAGAVSGGYGGSQHLYRDGFCSTGVQGEGVAVALGLALHARREAKGGMAVVYIGDGTWGQGVVYEALNMAQLWRAPLVVVVENNRIAQSTSVDKAMAGSIAGRAAGFGTRYQEVSAIWPDAIRNQLREPIGQTRDGGGPLVIEFHTHRLGPHSKGDDTRDREELIAIEEWDWYRRYEKLQPRQFAHSLRKQQEIIDGVVGEVMERPLIGSELIW